MILATRSPRTIFLTIVIATTAAACGGGGGGEGGSGGVPPPTSTVTSTSTTTTTIVGGGASYTVVLALLDAVTLGSVQLEVDYGDAGGEFVGSEAAVSCSSPLSSAGALVAFGDDDGASVLNIAALALAGFSGPTTLASCEFRANGAAPTAGDFAITVAEANAVDTTPITPLPAIGVASITPH